MNTFFEFKVFQIPYVFVSCFEFVNRNVWNDIGWLMITDCRTRRTNSFFCGEFFVVDKKHPNCSEDWHKVGTLSFQTCSEYMIRTNWQMSRGQSSSSIKMPVMQYITGNMNLIFLRKNVCLRQRNRNWKQGWTSNR